MFERDVKSVLRCAILWFTGTSAAYLGLGVVVFTLFYTNHPYDGPTGERVGAFELGFVISFAGHLFLTTIASAALARLLRISVWASLRWTASGLLILMLPTLYLLSAINACAGVHFPFARPDCPDFG